MTPILVLLLGAAPAVAVGTDLWFAAITKIAGGAVHGQRGGVDWQVARRLWCGSLPAALATLLWLQSRGRGPSHDQAILGALGCVLVLTGAVLLAKNRLHAWGRRQRLGDPAWFKRVQPVATAVAGALIGFLVTLTSVGAGALGAVILLGLYPLRMVPAKLVGTDIVHAVPLTLLAGLGHLWLGHVNWHLLVQLLAGSLPGIIAGSLASGRLPEPVLRAGIAVVLCAVGLKLLA